MFNLAADPVSEEAIGLAERLNKGGVPLVALFLCIIFAAVIIFLFYQLRKEQKDKYDFTNASLALALKESKEREADARKHENDTLSRFEKMEKDRSLDAKECALAFAKLTDYVAAGTRLLERFERSKPA